METREQKLEDLRRELNSELANNSHINDGSLADKVNQSIQWAWDNWDIDFSPFYEDEAKPESYTTSFREDFIENEDFDEEICED